VLDAVSRFFRTVLEEQLLKLVLITFGVVVLVFAIRSEWVYPLLIGGLLLAGLALRRRLRDRDA
jgi:chromate transport protein ChrA